MKSTSTSEGVTKEVTGWTTSQVVFATVFVVCVFLAFWLLYRLRGVVFLFFVAIVIGTAIRPGVEWLRRRGIFRRSGVILIYLLTVGLLVGFFAMTFPLLAEQTARQFSFVLRQLDKIEQPFQMSSPEKADPIKGSCKV